MPFSLPNGVYPTMITPYKDNLQVDFDAYAPLLDWYETHGVAGVFAICQSSEIFQLSFAERLAILRKVMRVRKPSTIVVASGHTSFDPETQIEEAKAFIAEGLDAYVFISNRFAAQDESDDVFLRNVDKVCSALGDTPLGVYECPAPYKRLLSPQTLRRMTEIGNFCFLKDTSCDVAQMQAKIEAVRGTTFKLYNANAATVLPSLQVGAAGFSGVMANFHPQLYAKICDCYESNPALAHRLQDFVGFASLCECQAYPINAKYHLQLEGVPITIASRTQEYRNFRGNSPAVIEQMRRSAQAFEKFLNI
ncbi:MAG: dihydrodipicolinate synthase family protein [Oscillospiraceae bacterium]|jgi:4-hydroxy-tetrahydrodipicolinate synthase|nr:dihydrodipicolinate synthase family protein [Oscillospiraceae bacterium]